MQAGELGLRGGVELVDALAESVDGRRPLRNKVFSTID
jgi:hypothetical protein